MISLSREELAARLGVDAARVDRLVDIGAIQPAPDGRFDPRDVHRVRLLVAFEDAGVSLDGVLAASRAGRISMAYYDRFHPSPAPAAGRPYRAFVASLGERAELLPRLFRALGLAAPAPGTMLTVEDEMRISELVEIASATGEPDLVLRTVRLYGEGARRAAEGAVDAYADAVVRDGAQLAALNVDESTDRLLEPWARFAHAAPGLAGWLAGAHLGRAIDQFTVTATEQVLAQAGFVADRQGPAPAVAFVDLTGFTELTQQRGDETAATVALRLGALATDVVEPRGGRVVKLLGDGVLLRFDEVPIAVEATLDLLAALGPAGLPTGHAGIASGPLIARDGDVFGRTVNMAARLSDAAPDGSVCLTADLAASLFADRFDSGPATRVDLRGIGSVDVVRVTRRPG